MAEEKQRVALMAPPAADDQVCVIFDGNQDELDDYLAELLVQLISDPE